MADGSDEPFQPDPRISEALRGARKLGGDSPEAAARPAANDGAASISHLFGRKPQDLTAYEVAERILASDRRLSHKIGYKVAPWLYGAAGWVGAAVVYFVATGQLAAQMGHPAVKAAWDNFWTNHLGPTWGVLTRHLVRGLPEGGLMGIMKARATDKIKKKERAEHYREAVTTEAPEKVRQKVGLRRVAAASKDVGFGFVALGAVVAGGYLLVQAARSGAVAPHLHGVDHALQGFGKEVSDHTKWMPSPLRAAGDLSDPTEDTGRIAGIVAHWAFRRGSKTQRQLAMDATVRNMYKRIEAGSVVRSHPWRGRKGVAIRRAAEQIVAQGRPAAAEVAA